MNWEILYKYVEGSCSEEELRRLGIWLSEDTSHEDFFKSFIEAWDQDAPTMFEADAQQAWEEFQARRLSESGFGKINTLASRVKYGKYPAAERKNKRDRWYWAYSVAAALILLFAVFVVIRYTSEKNEAKKESPVAYQEITTVRGQRTNLRLSDGTKVTLNSSSRLRIPANYGQDSRTIYLQGEAFFEVKHDEAHPFMVISNHAYVRDLGTRFNIMAYDSTRLEVAVKDGLVSMGKVRQGTYRDEIVQLTPNKLGILRNSGGLTVSDIDDIDAFAGWTEGKLVFRKTPFSEVARRLERWFDIDCKIEGDSLDKRRLTATYNNMPMSEVLRVVSLSLNLSYSRHKRRIIFRDKK